MNTTNATTAVSTAITPNMNESTMHTTPWKAYVENRESFRIRATYGWHKTGEQEPYWSVTGEIQRSHRGSWQEDSFGVLHDSIARHFPELSASLKWHLSSVTGGPMHYIENAVYWLEKEAGISQYPDKDDEEKAFRYFASTVVLGAVNNEKAPVVSFAKRLPTVKEERARLREVVSAWCLARKPALIAKMLEETGAVMALAT